MPFSNPHLNDSGQGVEAATRTSRFLARLMVGIVYCAALPLLFFPGLGPFPAIALLVAIFIGQGWLMVTRGQTIGKRLMHIYIMRSDGELPNIGWLCIRELAIPAAVALLRYGGHNDPTTAGQIFQVMLGFVWLADCLFILGPTRRCLHDLMAGTHVVMAE